MASYFLKKKKKAIISHQIRSLGIAWLWQAILSLFGGLLLMHCVQLPEQESASNPLYVLPPHQCGFSYQLLRVTGPFSFVRWTFPDNLIKVGFLLPLKIVIIGLLISFFTSEHPSIYPNGSVNRVE